MFKQDGLIPIYVQLAEWLETEILLEHFKQEDKIYSQYQLAEMFLINPATAAKGITLLYEEGILYKKRGLGMFVTKEAHQIITEKRIKNLEKKYVQNLVSEAKSLHLKKEEIYRLIENAYMEGK